MDPIDLLSPANQRIAQLQRERDEARAEVGYLTKRLDLEKDVHRNCAKQALNALARADKLEADNAKLRAEVAAHLYQLKLARTEWANILDEDAALRARLALAEAVCKAADSNIVGRLQDFLNDDAKRSAALGFHNLGEDWLQSHARMVKLAEALAKWREGNK